jgi:predicted N-acetyltransferase YhbS
MSYIISVEQPSSQEVYELFAAVGWPVDSVKTIQTSLGAYPCKICARTKGGALVGYASVFSDEVMTTMLGELIVHPQHQRVGIGKRILELIESLYPQAPVYIKALGESKLFYERIGFKTPSIEMKVMFKKPGS